MGFDADAAAERLKDANPPYPFTWKGEEHELPNMGMLSTNEGMALAEAMQNATAVSTAGGADDPDPSAFLALLELLDRLVPDKPSAEALRDMPGAVLAQLLMAWEVESMEDLGDLGKEPSGSSQPETPATHSPSTPQPEAETSEPSPSTRSAA